jgi:hypothetical protein
VTSLYVLSREGDTARGGSPARRDALSPHALPRAWALGSGRVRNSLNGREGTMYIGGGAVMLILIIVVVVLVMRR